LGILITTPAAFFAQARKLIKHHHALEEKIAEFRKQISLLSAANQELVRRHQIEAARLLASATTANMKSDHSLLQNQHPTTTPTLMNKSIHPSNDNKLITELIKKNGFNYHNDQHVFQSPSTINCPELALNNNYRQSAVPLNSTTTTMIPPPPSLTKVSHHHNNTNSTLICNNNTIRSSSIHPIDNDQSISGQHSLLLNNSSMKSTKTLNNTSSLLQQHHHTTPTSSSSSNNNIDVHKFA
ncbi:unnamed protein product, partial [Schistosoma turkestanicum]